MKIKLRTLKELLLYNYRYWFGYAMIASFMVYFLGWKISSYPGGLSQYELITAAKNVTLGDITLSPLYPAHSLLQWISMQILGINTLSLRLPGLIIGLLTAFALYHLLKRWFGKPTALLGTALFISADWFLFIARLGTGAIEFSLWLTVSLLCLTKILEKKTKWLISLTVSLGFLLFAPFGYAAVATIITTVFVCRIFRSRVLEAKKIEMIISGVIAFITLILFVVASVNSLDFLKAVLGLQNFPGFVQYFVNVLNNLGGVIAVLPRNNPILGPSGIFFVRFFELIFILFGLVMLWKTRVNRLNLLIITLGIVLAIVSGLSAGSRANGLILIPAAICIAAGLRHFMHRWQRTFPKNPYARMAAYIPLGALAICTVLLHYTSYFLLWQTQPASRSSFRRDLSLITNELKDEKYKDKTCFVESNDESLKKLIVGSNPICNITFKEEPTNFIIKHPDSLSHYEKIANTRPLVSEIYEDNVRWVVIESAANIEPVILER